MHLGTGSRLVPEWLDIISEEAPCRDFRAERLPAKADVKAAKKRDEVVATLELLSSSHLPSTFQSLSWALTATLKLLQAISPSSKTGVDAVLVTGPTPTTFRSRCFVRLGDFFITRYGERQQAPYSTTVAATNTKPAAAQVPRSCTQARTHLPVAPPNPVSPVEVEENDEEDDPEADASFVSSISDMSGALSPTAGERSEDERTGDDEGDEDEEEERDASSSIAHEDEEVEEESEEAFDEEYAHEEELGVLEDDTASRDSTHSVSTPP